MAIAFRAVQATKSAATNSTTIVMTVPTGTLDNDVMVMFLSGRAVATFTDPASWTLLSNSGATNLIMKIYWKVASSEPASYTVSTGAQSSGGIIISLSGASSTQPASTQFAQQTNASSLTITSPALGTFSSNNGIDLFLGAIGNPTDVAVAPTNYTLPTGGSIATGGTSTTGLVAQISYRSLSAITTVGSITATDTGSAAVNTGGHIFIFEAAAAAPTVTTTAVSDTGPTEVTVGGNVTSDGGATVTERGIVWATTANPTTANTKVIDGGSGTGAYTDNITGLSTSATYHYRAYAINSVGTSYGSDVQFTTTGQMLNNYQFFKVGDGLSVSEKIK